MKNIYVNIYNIYTKSESSHFNMRQKTPVEEACAFVGKVNLYIAKPRTITEDITL